MFYFIFIFCLASVHLMVHLYYYLIRLLLVIIVYFTFYVKHFVSALKCMRGAIQIKILIIIWEKRYRVALLNGKHFFKSMIKYFLGVFFSEHILDKTHVWHQQLEF